MSNDVGDCCHTKQSDIVQKGFAFLKGILREVSYQVVGDYAMYQGDIILGTVSEIEGLTRYATENKDVFELYGASLPSGTWPRKSVPYCIAANCPNQAIIAQAAAHWRANTGLSVGPLGPLCDMPVGVIPNPWPISFVRGTGCASNVGYQHRNQTITLADGCLFGQIVHEIGHAVGLFHEQSRPDRDQYVEIHWDNIQDDMKFNFDIDPAAVVAGPYDYGSIMHYGMYDFSKNGKPTITPKQVGVTIGQRQGLSPGDIAAVKRMYP